MEEGGSFEIWGKIGRASCRERVKFWTNRWCGDLSLQLAFPVLYNFAANREASVESSLICQGAGIGGLGIFVSIEVLMIGR